MSVVPNIGRQIESDMDRLEPVRRKVTMSTKLNRLIKLGETAGTTNAKIIERIVNAQDYALRRQKERAEASRKKANRSASRLHERRTVIAEISYIDPNIPRLFSLKKA